MCASVRVYMCVYIYICLSYNRIAYHTHPSIGNENILRYAICIKNVCTMSCDCTCVFETAHSNLLSFRD